MPESGTSGSAGGALGRSMVISTRARRWKRRIQPRESLQAAHQRPIPTAEWGQTPALKHAPGLRRGRVTLDGCKGRSRAHLQRSLSEGTRWKASGAGEKY
jgi:hypothetical protein